MVYKEKLLNHNSKGALRGILVIDFSRWVAGPYCTNMLSDMGATVIKVESLGGDQARKQVGGNLAAFHTYNHGKKSLAIDFQDARGKEVLYCLSREADIAVENYRPGMAEEMGIGYDDLSKINPAIIYCSINAFGSSPPEYANRAGVDMLVQSMGGIMSVTGMPGGPPVPAGIPIADQNGGIYGYAAIMTALYHRATTGIGQYVSVALIDTMVFSLSTRFAELIGFGKIPQRLGNAHSQIVPFQAFQTADGWVTVAALTEEQWKKVCEGLGAEELRRDPRYSSAKLRLENRESLTDRLKEYFKKRSAKEWLDIFLKADVMCAPLWNIQELISSDLILDHGFIPTVNHPIEGTYPVLQTPFNFSKTPGEVQGPAPLLGENTHEILTAIGYGKNKIKELLDGKVIKVANLEMN